MGSIQLLMTLLAMRQRPLRLPASHSTGRPVYYSLWEHFPCPNLMLVLPVSHSRPMGSILLLMVLRMYIPATLLFSLFCEADLQIHNCKSCRQCLPAAFQQECTLTSEATQAEVLLTPLGQARWR